MKTRLGSSAAWTYSNLIEELVMWENSNNPDVIRTARAEIARCVASRLIETGALKKDTPIGANTTANDLVKRGHCRPISLGLDTKAGRVRFSFDVSRLPPAEAVNAFLTAHAPPVLDPFAGGGSIPLEAQRLGLRAFASDLNPVPVLINKALIEIPPKFAGRPPVNPESMQSIVRQPKGKRKKQGSLVEKEWPGATGLAEDVRYYGQWMRDEAEKRIGHLYPKVEVTAEMAQDCPDLLPYVGQKLTVIAWIWARTVASPDPSRHGAHVPLVKSFWLSTKKNRTAWVNTIIDPSHNSYRFVVSIGEGSPKIEGTINRKGGKCLLSDTPIPFDHVRTAGKAQQMGCRLLAIVAEGNRGRVYISPLAEHEEVALKIAPVMGAPTAEMAHNPFSLRPPLYGLSTFAEIFSRRQMTALTILSDLLAEVHELVVANHHSCISGATGRDANQLTSDAQAYADAVITYLAFAIDKGANYWSSMCAWSTSTEKMVSTFGRQAIPMVWDFAEANPFSDSTGNFLLGVDPGRKSFLRSVPLAKKDSASNTTRQRHIQPGNSFLISNPTRLTTTTSTTLIYPISFIFGCVGHFGMPIPTYSQHWLSRKQRRSSLVPTDSRVIETMQIDFLNQVYVKKLSHRCGKSARRRLSAWSVFYAFKQVEEAEDGEDQDHDSDVKR